MSASSAWAMAPDRGIDILEKEEFNQWDSMWEDPPSFQPELISAPELREKVRSSGYGDADVTVNRVELEKEELRPWQEVPTFQPEVQACPIRDNAKSSNYGEIIPTVPVLVPEKPTFQPVMERSQSGTKIFAASRSSGYGKNTAPARRPMTAPSLDFKPVVSKCKVRERVTSSRYGKVTARSPNRPSTAPSGAKRAYVPRYTLAADQSPKEAEKELDERQKGFVLDCVRTTKTGGIGLGYFPLTPKSKPSPLSKAINDKAMSSNYMEQFPEVKEKAEFDAPEASLRFDVSTSILTQELEPGPMKTDLADKVRSSAYGENFPEVGEKAEIADSEPVWASTMVVKIPEEVAPVDRNPQTENAGSHGYGKVSPIKAPLYEVVSEPLWVPPGKAVKKTEPIDPPVSKLNETVKSHYGADYKPFNPYEGQSGDEEEFLDGDSLGQANGGARVRARTTGRIEAEYDQEGFPQEEVEYENGDDEDEDDMEY